jgi:hypothetical protein
MAVCFLGLLGRAWGEELPPAPRLPDLVRTTNTTFAIPFKVAPSQQADHAAARVLLQASKDLGATWAQAGEAGPEAGSIVYRAAADGEYWFRLRAIDGKGRQRGGEGPDMRVLVDAAAPRVTARVWRGNDGEIVCRYAAADDTLDLPKMVVEYQTKAEPTWKKIAAEKKQAANKFSKVVEDDTYAWLAPAQAPRELGWAAGAATKDESGTAQRQLLGRQLHDRDRRRFHGQRRQVPHQQQHHEDEH